MLIEDAVKTINIHGLARSKTILAEAPPDAECFSWELGDSGVRDMTVVLSELREAVELMETLPGGFLAVRE